MSDITTMTAEALALRTMTKAVERIKMLEYEAISAFEELSKARESCQELGIVVDVELSAGISAAYSSYKTDKARHDAHNDEVFNNG